MTGQLCLTLVDTSSIQHYIFGSNRLKENAGGSEVVRLATDDALRQACERVCGRAVAWRTVTDAPQAPALLQDGPEQAALLFAAAGNAALLFRSREVARQVITAWSRQLLVQAPGLRVAVVHEPFFPGELGKQWWQARQRLAKAKEAPPPAGPLQGISLTRSCPNTGMAAAGAGHWLAGSDITDDRPVPVQRASRALSPMAACRLDCAPAATRRLKEEFGDILGDHFTFPDRAEDLGQREGENYLAVVHADGNGLGKRFAKLLAEDGGDDGRLVERIQQFVGDVQRAGTQALRAVISALVHDYDSLVKEKCLRKTCEESGEWRLPIRPLVFGGDDVTFVCHGRLGLSLAARYLQAFASEKDSDGTPFSACAGVTIAHAKAPFARAYRLAEDLCRSAKARDAVVDGPRASWLDAHLAIDGLELPLHEIRAARVMPRDKEECALDGRPWRVVPDEGESPSWSAVQQAMRCFSGKKWPRSVTRELLHAFTVSESAVAMMLAQQRNRPLDGAYVGGTSPRLQRDSSGRTFVPLFDALELYEYFWEVS
ncbi:MAG: hypothetical protein M1118_06560 [Chloroflexi bacterium]|nr:hypothetical protein [Chloroflexota bacterium]